MLRRLCVLLRVVHNPTTDKWDGLDMPTDECESREELFAYRLVPGTQGSSHVLVRADKSAGGRYAVGEYEFIDRQPQDADMRKRRAWVAWCESPSQAHLAVGFEGAMARPEDTTLPQEARP